MFGRPRCREWTPLTTQQLRLRGLIQIVGYNIRPPEWCTHQCSYYLTLHHTTMSAPFYTSERICSPHPKWKEIDSEIIQRMSSTNIVIRIWCHILVPPSRDDDEKSEQTQDTVIQTWGVYFSGLRYIGANLSLNFTSDCFKSNTLVFQMHGGYFCSYKSLKLDVIPPENELEQGSLSSDSSGKTSCFRITLEPKIVQNYKLMQESRSVSPGRFSKISEREYSKSQSPVERGFRQNIPTLRNSSSLNASLSPRDRREGSVERKKADPNHIYEHSPDNVDIREFSSTELNCDISNSREELSSKVDLSETAESYDLRNESDVPKYRYLAINFLKSEIRPSYNATKLQSLHLLQYSIKKRQEAVQEIKERIYQKSALTESLSPDLEVKLKGKSRSHRNLFSPEESDDLRKEKSSSQTDLTVKNGRIKEDRIPVSNGPRLTLKLNDLLSFKSKPSPFQRAEYLRLTKQLEILHFKRLILSDERDSKLANIRRLKEQHAKLFEENQDVGSELMQNYHALSRRTEQLKELRESCYALRELAARSHAALASHRTNMLMDLHKIFYIEQKEPTVWSICDIPLPICGDDSPRASNPVPDSVAAGFVAQATSLAAAILNQPLRYKITLLGSASKILDITPDLPDPNIPLFARGGDITLFRYALFLLNKCIAQLLWGRGLNVYDMRPTLANLQRLLTTPSNLSDTSKLFGTYRWLVDGQCARTQSLRNLVPSDRTKYRQFNRFKECVDSHSPLKGFSRRHKHSRSVGSYRDDQDLSALNDSTLSIMGSESNIYDMKLAKSECSQNLKQHNSDSEITNIESRLDSDRVQFTLGDDTDLDEKLVRLSSNNDDEVTCSTCLDENVKRICSEINSFCSDTSKSGFESPKSGFELPKSDIDIAKYMERKASVEVEEALDCENCDSEKTVCDLECANNVRDVIVIPSAEAILDHQDLNLEERDV